MFACMGGVGFDATGYRHIHSRRNMRGYIKRLLRLGVDNNVIRNHSTVGETKVCGRWKLLLSEWNKKIMIRRKTSDI